ncbi:hypothetical protein NX801_13755 [Streptomyces sp. LP05-1]|uniref:Uncharacterized protein n=1 Tax=Streptomyces pyxinae TaxID=2970734 RepID=A0ABT2CHC5_9ACTN|nr:hypothetical protein [Streptomyces sp. LP05-1]MCS0636705.1 hypothetical protein [Streptomyces sp. LP05-1]
MQISEPAMYVAPAAAEETAPEHPAGRVTLALGGALGLRSRLLSASDGTAGYSHDVPYTTMTIPV